MLSAHVEFPSTKGRLRWSPSGGDQGSEVSLHLATTGMAAWLFCRNAQTPGRARGDDAGNVGTDTIHLVVQRDVRSLVDREEQCGVPRAPSSTLTSPNGGRSATYAICDRFSSCLASEMRSPFSSRLGCASNALATGSSSILLLLYSLKVSIAGSVGRLGVVSRTNGARVSFFPRGRPRRGAQHVRRCPAPAEKSSMHGSGCRVAKESDVVFAPQRKGHFFCQALGDSEAWDDNLAVVLLDSHIIAESPGETIAVLPSSRPRPRPADRCKTSTCKCTFSRSPECVAQARGRRSLSVPMPP